MSSQSSHDISPSSTDVKVLKYSGDAEPCVSTGIEHEEHRDQNSRGGISNAEKSFSCNKQNETQEDKENHILIPTNADSTVATNSSDNASSRLRAAPARHLDTKVPNESVRINTFTTVRMVIPSHVQQSVSSNWVLNAATRAVCHYVLYARGMIPTPIHDICSIVREECSESLPASSKMFLPQERHSLKKMKNFASSLEALWNDVDLLLSSQHHQSKNDAGVFEPLQLLVTLGAAWSRPKEHYLISWTANHVTPESETMETDVDDDKTAQWRHALSRRLVREMVHLDDQHQTSPSMSGTASASNNVFLSVKVPSGIAQSLLEKSRQDENNSNVLHLLSNRLVVRHGFSIPTASASKATKKKQTPLYSILLDSTGTKGDTVNEDDDGVWLSFRAKVKGFRL